MSPVFSCGWIISPPADDDTPLWEVVEALGDGTWCWKVSQLGQAFEGSQGPVSVLFLLSWDKFSCSLDNALNVLCYRNRFMLLILLISLPKCESSQHVTTYPALSLHRHDADSVIHMLALPQRPSAVQSRPLWAMTLKGNTFLPLQLLLSAILSQWSKVTNTGLQRWVSG